MWHFIMLNRCGSTNCRTVLKQYQQNPHYSQAAVELCALPFMLSLDVISQLFAYYIRYPAPMWLRNIGQVEIPVPIETML